MLKVVSLILLLLAISSQAALKRKHPEDKLPFMKYCAYFNYPAEEHKIVTEDGYILTFFRIQAKYSQIKPGLKPIYLQHGLIDRADTYIINSEDIAPAFMLANRGYDVWLGNSRGNTHSRAHVSLNPDKDPQYWSFSFMHMAQYDLPAAFQQIAKMTNSSKIDYIGHSQGSLIMQIALSEQNAVVKKYLNHFIAFGPVAYIQHQYSVVFSIMEVSGLQQQLERNHIYEFWSFKFRNSVIGRNFCAQFSKVCSKFIGLFSDADSSLDNDERYGAVAGHNPSGTSTMNMIHFKQMLHSTFQKYDQGLDGNLKIYGTPTPPKYDLSKIDVPVYLMAGTSDTLATPIDVQLLVNQLVNSPKVWYKQYNAGHLTFIWGKKEYMTHMADVFQILEGKL